MEANAIWEGADYAWEINRGRGGPLNLNCERVKIIKKFDKVKPGRKRASTFCEVMRLTDDGEIYTDVSEVPQYPYWIDKSYDYRNKIRIEIEAREIISLWDDYDVERAPLLEEKRKQEELKEQRRQEEEVKRQERMACYSVSEFLRKGYAELLERKRKAEEEKKEAHRRRIQNVLITRGFKREEIQMYNGHVTIPLSEIERWLGIDPIESSIR